MNLRYVSKTVKRLEPGDYLPDFGIITIVEPKKFSESYKIYFYQNSEIILFSGDTKMLVGEPWEGIADSMPLLIGVNYE